MNSQFLKCKIEKVSYKPFFQNRNNEKYSLEIIDFNNNRKGELLLNNTTYNFYVWRGPKRTRTYPFAGMYDAKFSSNNNKTIAIIPIIKDEGKDTNLDRINSITLAWMNLLNIHIILAYYVDADKHPTRENRISNQKIDNQYVKEKIKELDSYILDAHHWNNNYFKNEFIFLANKSISSYEKISNRLNLQLHNRNLDKKWLKEIITNNFFNLDKFIHLSIKKSKEAAKRESCTIHKYEYINNSEIKGILEIRNNLGGDYFLTCDNLIIKQNKIKIIESKSSSKLIPDDNNIKDALFKIVLFKNISEIIFNNNKYYDIDIEIEFHSSKFTNLQPVFLPTSEDEITNLPLPFDDASKNKLLILNKESKFNNFAIKIGYYNEKK